LKRHSPSKPGKALAISSAFTMPTPATPGV
jgi:hypothetical protein